MSDDGSEARDRRRNLDRLVRQLAASHPGRLRWSEVAGQTPDQRQRYRVWRGDAPRRRALQTVVNVALFDDPDTGKGRVEELELALLERCDRPGDTRLRLELRPTAATGDRRIGWTGPASGRLFVAGAAFDFDADDGSWLDRHGDTLVLEARLGAAWVDRDETHEELIAALDGMLVLREPL